MSLNYQIALTNVPFDKDYKNVIRFGTREEQEEYFQVSSLFSTAPDVNLNAGNLFETTLLYKYPDNTDITDMLNANYCIVKNKTQNASLKYLYFFIEDIVQDSAGQVKLRVKMDIFQTYYIDTEFSPCHISKAHLNRWIDNGDNTVSFDGTVTSKLFEREELQNVAKRLVKRTRMNVKMFNTESDQTEFDNNVLGWLYVYLDPFTNFSFRDYNESTHLYENVSKKIKTLNDDRSPANFSILCVPIGFNRPNGLISEGIYGNLLIPINSNDFIEERTYFTIDAVQKFLEHNGGYSHVFGVKISVVPPHAIATSIIRRANDLYDVGLTNYIDRIVVEDELYSSPLNYVVNNGCFVVYNEWESKLYPSIAQTPEYTINDKMTFQKSDIIGSNKQTKFNPKLLNSDYKSLKISSYVGQGFEYDIQKLNKEKFKISITEPLTPEITRTYTRISKDYLDGIYIAESSKNLTGEVSNSDNQLPQITSYMQNALAFQKNFFLQNTLNLADKSLSRVWNAQTPVGLAGSLIGTAVDIAQFGLTVDNMKNAPSDVKNAEASIRLKNAIDGIRVYVEEFDILENEKNIVNDYMDMYGFTVNLIGNIKDYDNIRKYHNYIRANVEQTNGIPISEKVHEEFVRTFARGVRFWNVVEGVDLFKYDLENYEIALEE